MNSRVKKRCLNPSRPVSEFLRAIPAAEPFCFQTTQHSCQIQRKQEIVYPGHNLYFSADQKVYQAGISNMLVRQCSFFFCFTENNSSRGTIIKPNSPHLPLFSFFTLGLDLLVHPHVPIAIMQQDKNANLCRTFLVGGDHLFLFLCCVVMGY